MPLMWAHAEYIKLLRSAADGRPFDLIPEVAERYLGARAHIPLEVWKSNRMIRSVPAGTRLRVQAAAPFILHWSKDEWSHVADSRAQATSIGIYFVDIELDRTDLAPVRFTFFWLDDGRWEGRDHAVEVRTP
jgi:glucoamylase